MRALFVTLSVTVSIRSYSPVALGAFGLAFSAKMDLPDDVTVESTMFMLKMLVSDWLPVLRVSWRMMWLGTSIVVLVMLRVLVTVPLLDWGPICKIAASLASLVVPVMVQLLTVSAELNPFLVVRAANVALAVISQPSKTMVPPRWVMKLLSAVISQF